MIKKLLLLVVNVFLISVTLFSQPPDGYYDNALGKTGTQLQSVLHDIIDNHTVRSYTQLWTDFQTTDKKANGYVWDMYSDKPASSPDYDYTFVTHQCGNYSAEGDCYNREHSFPKSWFDDASPMYTDLFQLYPTDGYVNGQRGNYPFGEVSSPTWTSTNGSEKGPCSYSGYTGTVFEPIDEYKGDFARTYFYMATRYYNEDGSWTGSDMVDGAQPKTWALNMLKEWNTNDPVSTKETDRNDAVYSIQGNRNPFIDHPEYVGDIWGTTAPSISNIAHSPANPTSADAVTVTADITDDGTISTVTLKWCTDGSSFNNNITMSVSSGDTYTTNSDIPAQTNGTTVSYKIEATDNDSETSTSSIHEYTIGTSSSANETFANFTETGSSYVDGTFTGQDGSTWTYKQCRGDEQIIAETPCLGKERTPIAQVYSGTISGGCGILKFDYQKPFSTDINLEVYVNSTLVSTITSSSSNVESTGDITVNISGDFTLKFIQKATTSGQVSIDNIEWTSYSGSGNTIETFDNCTVGASYVDDNFVGVNGITWNYIQSRDEDTYGITGNGLMLRDLANISKCYSQTITTGIGDFSVQLKKAFTGAGNRQVELFINSVSYGTSASFDDTDTHTFTVNDINISGDVVIDIRNITSYQVLIDNISWTDFTGSGGGGCASDLIISEYVEGSSGTNKYLEIYNGTSSDVDLSNYDVVLYRSGGPTPDSPIQLNSVTLSQGDVYVLANSDADAWSGTPDQTSGSLDFNGDDVVALRKNSTNIDVIGTIGTSTNFAADNQLQRKSTITAPTTTYNTDEWNISSDSYNDLGEHVMTCCTCPATQASNFSSSSVTASSITIGWTRGNGNKVLVLAHEGSEVDKDPSSGSTYTGNTVFGSGEELGTENYVVYDGTGTSVDITDLSALTTYYFAVYEYNTSDNCYNQIELTGNETTIAVPEPTNHATNFAISSYTHQVIQLTWTDASTGTIPENYLIKMSDVSYADISDPVDGTAEADGASTKNISQGAETCTFSSLTAETTYYFKIYPYTNSGTDIDYKIGSEPQVSQTTDATPAGGCASDLIISEYHEPSGGNNKGIEVYNGTGASVNLSTYYIGLISNGGTAIETSVQLTGTLNDGETACIYNDSDTDPLFRLQGDLNIVWTGALWNGDDAVYLCNGGTDEGDIIDAIGDMPNHSDPGAEFSDNGVGTANTTLQRNSSVTSPTTSWSGLEWTEYAAGTYTDWGSHTMTCGPEDPPTAQASSITFSNVTTNSFTINWTNGNGDGRIVKINTSQTIADPVDGSDPTANASYSGGQQVVYNGSSNSVAVTNLSSNTQYFVKVFEKNGSSSSIAFLTTNAPENNQITTNATSGATTIAFQGFEGTANDTWNFIGDEENGVSYAKTDSYGRRIGGSQTQTLTFNSVDISSYSSVKIKIANASVGGIENSDAFELYVALNGGAFPTTPDITLKGSTSNPYNTTWDYNATGEATTTAGTPTTFQTSVTENDPSGYANIEISIPDGTNSVELKIISTNNKPEEYYYIDDVEIISNQTFNSSNTDHFRSCTNGDYNTQATWQSSADSSNWYSASLIPDQIASSLVISDYNNIFLSNDVTVNNLSLVGDGSLSMGADNHTITLQGNLNISSGATLDLSRTGTLLKCSGANAQNISGAGTISIYNFEIDKSSENVTLDRDLTINNGLTLTTGNIITGLNILTVDNDATTAISGYGINSYVNSKLKRKISTSGGSYDFSVGSDYYELADINFNNLTSSATPYITAQFNKTITGSAPNILFTGTPINELLNNGFWTITPTDVSTVNYDISLTSRGQTNGGTSAAQHIHVKRNNAISAWSASDGTHNNGEQTGTGTNPITVIKHGLTSFSDHATGKGDYVLPIELVDFKASVVNNNVQISWTTASEQNNDYFTVERSIDAINFDIVELIQGAGNFNKIINYKSVDYSPYQGISYYRLKQTDFDGKYSYSNIVSVNNVKNYVFSINKLFVDKDKKLHLIVDNFDNENFTIDVFDIMGRVVLHKEYSFEKNQQLIDLNINKFNQGIYNVIIYNSKTRCSQKIVVE